MKPTHIVFGPWQLRHGEPLSLADPESTLSWLPLPPSAATGAQVSVVDLDQVRASADRADGRLPLALVDADSAATANVTHLLCRLERGLSLFLRPSQMQHAALGAGMANRLHALFESNHLSLNNFECHYLQAPATRDIGTTFEVPVSTPLVPLAQRIQHLTRDGRALRLSAQVGNQRQQWRYRYRLRPAECDEGTWVLAQLNRSRTKSAEETRHSSYLITSSSDSDRLVGTTPRAADGLAEVATPAQPRVEGILSALVLGFEGLETGQLYQVVLSATTENGQPPAKGITLRQSAARWAATPADVQRDLDALHLLVAAGAEMDGAALTALTQRDALERHLNLHGMWS